MSGASVFLMKASVARNGAFHAKEFHTAVAVCGDRMIEVTDQKEKKAADALASLTAAMCIDCPRRKQQPEQPPTQY